MGKANYINHIGLVLDASGSMSEFKLRLIEVADAQIRYLAQRSKELDQETRISVWTFGSGHTPLEVDCVVWDKDVLRLPSIAEYYKPHGMTALIDGTLQAISDLRETPERYGDHSFLFYVLSDGLENASRNSAQKLTDTIAGLPDNWTAAALVPNQNGKHEAKRFGFPAGNIEVWDSTTQQGVTEVGENIRKSTDLYMVNRTTGTRSTKTLFSTQGVTPTTIKKAGMVPLNRGNYMLVHVPGPDRVVIKDFTEACGHPYKLGNGYYQLAKPEKIQPQKKILIITKDSKQDVFTGGDARALLGLPDHEARVRPDHNPDFDIFVQSTSVNRYLMPHTKYLYMVTK